MALSCFDNPGFAARVITPAVAPEHVIAFLLEHMLANLDQIASQIGRSVDDAQTLLHGVIERLGRAKEPGKRCGFDSKEARQVWEKELSVKVIRPELQELNQKAAELSRLIERDQGAAESALFAVIKEKQEDVDSEAKVMEGTAFWTPMERIELDGVPFKIGAQKVIDFY